MKYIISLLLCFPFLLPAQVVNTEKMRINRDESGITGEVNLSLGLIRNKAGQTLRVGSSTRLELLQKNSRWLMLGGYNISQSTKVDEPGASPKIFVNNGFGHLRYNLNINARITGEAFLQSQFNEVQEVRFRQLAGVGPRFSIVQKDSLQLFFGLLYMYEYEETSGEAEIVYNRDHRLSNYLSLGFQPTPYLSVNHVSYFQPNLRDFNNDFRISSETTLDIQLSAKLSLRTYFQLVYDEKPPIGVPRTMYSLTNGLSWLF